MSMATKLSMVVNYQKGLSSIKSCKFLITWTCENLWQPKAIISTLSQCLWPLNLAGWWITFMAIIHKVKWRFDKAVLRDHVTNVTYHISPYTIAIDIKICRVVTYCERMPSLKPHDNLKNLYLHCLMAIERLMATKLCRVLASRRSFCTQMLKS